ncbi:MAG TPA: cobyrinate a,c-diamide synthase [Burkholderiaceae bacterium]|nr:cobyrinate a,c-diamide synthase [Burkholderiaceae bacterium]
MTLQHRLLISAAHKSSGKTTVSIGLAAALARRGLRVQPFKKGPDYIDPLWLGQAAGRACRNLDPYLAEMAEVRAAFLRGAAGTDVALVEGNKGLYDGLALDGSNSNAALAAALELPVVLVLDARGMTRGIAPLILGYQAFDRSIRIAGVILNRLGGGRHEAKLRAVIEHYTDVPVLGAVHEDAQLSIGERHLGLVPASEAQQSAACIDAIARQVAAGVDLDRVLALTEARTWTPAAVPAERVQDPRLRIAIARDRAFGFYYADDLDNLERAGAQLIAFDMLAERALPEADALFIGGGFPEVFAAELSANRPMLRSIRSAIEGGMPTYAECGGLMVLARSIAWNGLTYPMAGAIPGDVVMESRPVGRGYVHLEETPAHPWPQRRSDVVRAHEFHYSRLVDLAPGMRFAYQVRRGFGIDGQHDGVVHRNVLASYTHLRSVAGADWPRRFVAFAQAVQMARPTPQAALAAVSG